MGCFLAVLARRFGSALVIILVFSVVAFATMVGLALLMQEA